MRANFVEVLIVCTTLTSVLLPIHTSTVKEVYNFCEQMLTSESVLKWSPEKQKLVTSSDKGSEEISTDDVDEFGTSPDTSGHEQRDEPINVDRKKICIMAPDDHHVAMRIYLDPALIDEPIIGNCPPYSSECKVSCLKVYETGNSQEDVGKDDLVTQDAFLGTSVRPTKSNKSSNGTGKNSTKTMEQIDRFPRNSALSLRNQIPKGDNFSVKISRKRQRTHKCKKCKKKLKRRRKHRAHKRKLELFQLLLQYHELLMGGNAVALPKDSNDTHFPIGMSYSRSGTMLKSAALKAMRERIGRRFVEPEKRKADRRVQTKSIVQGDDLQTMRLPQLPEMRTPTSLSPDINRMDQERRKRQALRTNNTGLNEAFANPEVSPETGQPVLTLCGLKEQLNTSVDNFSEFFASDKRNENTTLIKVSRIERSSDDTFPYWISLEEPISFESSVQNMELDVINEFGADDNLLRFLVLKITFVPNDPQIFEDIYLPPEEIQQSPPTESIRYTSKSPATGKKLSNAILRVNPMSEQERSSIEYNKSKIIAIGIPSGVAGILILAGICIYLILRTRRRKSSSFSGKRREEDLIDGAESEKCLSTDESSQPQYKSTKKKNYQDENLSDMTEESEFIMLEHEKPRSNQLQRSHHHHSHSKQQHCRLEDLTTTTIGHHNNTHNSKHHHNHMQTKCKHPNGARGSSRHVHCIVCQIAENPHQPIVTAQYAEFLPPASRQNVISGGCGTLPNNNFDKFNRMQNNPYRYSPSLPVRHLTLPSTVHLPDGEDLHKSRTEHKNHHTLSGVGHRDTSFMKPPPNRTIFESEALPFGSTTNLHEKIRKVSGYPGPPTSGSKHNRIGSKHHSHEDSRVNLISCLSDGNLKYSSHHRGPHEKDNCICKYILGHHINEPPPEYSDVIREGESDSSTTSHCVDNLNNNIDSDTGSESTKPFLKSRELSKDDDDDDDDNNINNNNNNNNDGTIHIKNNR